MGMPSINISFTEVAASAIKRGERGIIAMILKESSVPATNPMVISSAAEIPNTLSDFNKTQLGLALKGYINTPLRVIAYFIDSDDETLDYAGALAYLQTVKFDYLVCPTATTDSVSATIASYVATERTNNKLIKAVLPNYTGDSEAIINYTTAAAYVDDTVYTAEQFCSRIAGIIAGTPLDISATYAPVPELTDCTRLTKAQMDSAVEAGELIIWFDGEKVKTARAVNSLTTLTSAKNTQFQKIKIVDIMDMISTDIRMTAEDNYLGKYANSYANKGLLISAIGAYFDVLIREGLIESYKIGIDVDANRTYLKGKGVDVDSMSDAEIMKANTGSYVYLTATLSVLDAIEDIVLPITI